jgi:hypothetical protein
MRTARGAVVAVGALVSAACGSGGERPATATRPAAAAASRPSTSGAILVRSGRIGRPGEVDGYGFSVAPRTRVSLEARRVDGVCGANRTFTWSVRSAGSSRPVLDKPLYVSGFCRSPGPLLLVRGGSYVLTVRAPRGTVGPYAFTVWRAPVDEFAVRIGAIVRPGLPGKGAGKLEVSGSVDSYTFAATPGTRIVVDARELAGWCGHGEMLRWSLYGERLEKPVVVSQLLYGGGVCHDSDPVTLPVAGRYDLVVHGEPFEWDHGEYAFFLVPVSR